MAIAKDRPDNIVENIRFETTTPKETFAKIKVGRLGDVIAVRLRMSSSRGMPNFFSGVIPSPLSEANAIYDWRRDVMDHSCCCACCTSIWWSPPLHVLFTSDDDDDE